MDREQENDHAPRLDKGAFHCPRCSVYAGQYWLVVVGAFEQHFSYTHGIAAISVMEQDCPKEFKMARCAHCRNFSFWVNEKLVYPARITAPLAHKDMPESVLKFYDEARKVSPHSHRSSAALLRIAAKKLCEELGANDANLSSAIKKLGEIGVPENVIKSLDAVRIFGNEGGAHEGQIDLTGEDNKEVVDKLFWLINFVVEKTITEPREVNNMFSSVPKNKKQGVESRDRGKQ